MPCEAHRRIPLFPSQFIFFLLFSSSLSAPSHLCGYSVAILGLHFPTWFSINPDTFAHQLVFTTLPVVSLVNRYLTICALIYGSHPENETLSGGPCIFSKKSETRPGPALAVLPPSPPPPQTFRAPAPLPELPPANDFRTSLILPDLSRRFSLLRSSSGDPVSFEHLRSRLAEQRARGAEHQISVEEEDMILETLGKIRAKNSTLSVDRSQESILDGAELPSRQSIRSTSTVTSSVNPPASPSSTGRSTKRYSNNLFGSGRFRDYTYMRSVAQSRNGSIRTLSTAPTESSISIRDTPSISDSVRPVTPEGSVISSLHSSPNDKFSIRSAPLIPPTPYGEQSLSAADIEAIKEIEEEAEDEIVMPRSTPVPRANVEQPHALEAKDSETSPLVEAGMAISSDKQVHSNVEDRRASPIPSRILPGYIPGMPRPMTPRDFDSDDQRSHSTTPRATSPILAGLLDSSTSSSPIATLFKQNSISSGPRQSPRPTSPSSSTPLFLQRTTNGRFTPDDSQRITDVFSSDRKRPASPLAGPPSNQWLSHHGQVLLRLSLGPVRIQARRSKPTAGMSSHRSARSPALSDSPLLDRAHMALPLTNTTSTPPNGNRTTRSPTPTQSVSRSPTSPTFSNFEQSSKNGSRRSSKQTTPSSQFNLGPYPSLMFSPIANSSRSSLESAGSSYHSWDGDHKDRFTNLFSDTDMSQPAWHDIPYSDKSSSATPGGSPEDEFDAESIIAQYAGLKKADFLAIQEKLVSVAIAKTSTPDIRDRVPSLRRRRPSTSQSNYSVNGRENRIASPPPQLQPPSSPTPTPSSADQYSSKASALLNSVVDSIRGPQDTLPVDSLPPQSPIDKDISPTTRRNRDLAKALFGQPEETQSKSPTSESSPPKESPKDEIPQTEIPKTQPEPNPSPPQEPRSPATPTSPYLMRNPSTPRIPQTPQQEADLTREVQQKVNAATKALKSKTADGLVSTGSIRRRINPGQISTPHLISASTSVDTIPLPSPPVPSALNPGPSKLGSRLKRLKGTLRAKHTVYTGDEVTPYPLDPHTPPAMQTAQYDPERLGVPNQIVSSATEPSRYKVPVPSPPASAGPGFKGFMSRFRAKPRAEMVSTPESERRTSPLPPSSTPTSAAPQTEKAKIQPQSISSDISGTSSGTTRPPLPPSFSAAVPPQESHPHQPEAIDVNESVKQQLFGAADILGLDQSALRELLARSTSTSSRSTDWTLLTRNNSSAISSRPGTRDETANEPRLAPANERPSTDSQQDPDLRPPSSDPNGRPSMDGRPLRTPSMRKQSDYTRKPREGQGDNAAFNAVVRRTIIFPSESRSSTVDLNALLRKNSSRRRRASASSFSSRSMPISLSSQAETLLHVPAAPAAANGPIEKSSSTYDSLYEMYAGEGRVASSSLNDPSLTDIADPELLAASESGPAIQLVELANGETIWSIVNGLRDDDDESGYASRASFASEYSTRETSEGVQIFVKEHGRAGSKSSTSNGSLVSRKKSLTGKNRPETKVFYSSSAQIGRLIENLSQGMDAGSFNFAMPTNRVPGHSASSSMSTKNEWSVEEQLEHMLGTVGGR
ncbi:hypothetical protein BD779DRAFT_1669167 [Infundibulicybe gibba]|nr:hypothetical protein BD779DRAFT_1669167 [Infundibulicybe gibba]